VIIIGLIKMIIIKCKRCGFEFGRIIADEAAFASIEEVLGKYGFRCPRCIRKIPANPYEWLISIESAVN